MCYTFKMRNAETNIGKCRLCDRISELQNSHILPAFAFRWLKKRGITGHLRSAINPNRRSQDGIRMYLLCKSCEESFGNHERSFSSHAFYPAVNENWSGEYKKWLLKFCVSVSWRVLVSRSEESSKLAFTDEQERSMLSAESIWKEFLLGQSESPRSFVQQIVLWGKITNSTDPKMPQNINRYLSGPIEMDIISTSDFLATFVKLGPFMIFGIVQQGKETWHGTQVKVNGGRIFEAKIKLPHNLLGYIRTRANDILKLSENLSDSQMAQIENDVTLNIPNISNSPQFKSMLADAELFGLEAITTLRKPKKSHSILIEATQT